LKLLDVEDVLKLSSEISFLLLFLYRFSLSKVSPQRRSPRVLFLNTKKLKHQSPSPKYESKNKSEKN